MKALGNLAVIFLVILGLLALIPLISLGVTVLGTVMVIAIWVLPIWIIASSEKTTGFEKIAWLLAMVCLSWFAWVFYFFLAPLKPRHRYYY
jgi:O-antigen/teichoic acid export membrane protein